MPDKIQCSSVLGPHRPAGARGLERIKLQRGESEEMRTHVAQLLLTWKNLPFLGAGQEAEHVGFTQAQGCC